MLTLKLFNGVLAKGDGTENAFISKEGYIIEPGAVWAKNEIEQYYRKEKLSGNDLNKSFHKSWKKVISSTHEELVMEQLEHYASTYGSKFKDQTYIPNEVLNVPDVKLKFNVVHSFTEEELTQKCLSLLQSGMALESSTITELLGILFGELNYQFTGKENIRNKEATIMLADVYGHYPGQATEFLRFLVYKATGETLLIKNKETIEAIKSSNAMIGPHMAKYDPIKLAEIFNRFKPLFLAMKGKNPTLVNKISKLSKKYHKPLVFNPLNNITNTEITDKDRHWLDNATPYALMKALGSLHTRMHGRTTFMYRIRNGKSFVKPNSKSDIELAKKNYAYVIDYMKERFDLSNTKFFMPEDIEYAMPTSEKQYVGNVPTGTRFIGETLAVGIYWENSWGARDHDLSGFNIGGKVGWNSDFKQGNDNLIFSGDITNAPNGAVEYLRATNGLRMPTLIKNNVYSGSSDAGYKIIVGKGSEVNYNFMMDPNKVFAEIRTSSVQKQTLIGFMVPVSKDKQSFILLNVGAGHARVSGISEHSDNAHIALFEEWTNPLMFADVAKALGAEFVQEPTDADFDLSLDNLQKDTFVEVFNYAENRTDEEATQESEVQESYK